MKQCSADIPDEMWFRIETWRAQQKPIPNKGDTIRLLLDTALRREQQSDSRLTSRIETLEKQVQFLLRATK